MKETTERYVKAMAEALESKKGQDIEVLKVSELTSLTEYFVICTATSTTQVKALADNVSEELAKCDVFPRRTEGYGEGRWCVMDFGDVMVHIFHEQDREYYLLERLWADGSNELALSFEQEGEDAEA